MDTATISPTDRAAVEGLASDLRGVFGERLQSVCAYGLEGRAGNDPLNVIALVTRLAFDDLAAAAPLVKGWRRRGLNVPLILEREEFHRTLDVFPLEYGGIIAHHVVIAGADPFAGAQVSPADLRRAIELQAKSHLIHLREGFLESQGDPESVARLIGASAPSLRALLSNIGRLAGDPSPGPAEIAERQVGIPALLVQEVMSAGDGARGTVADPTELFVRYLAAAERIWEFVDAWR